MSRPLGENAIKVMSNSKYFILEYETKTVSFNPRRNSLGLNMRSAYYSVKSKDKLIKAIRKIKSSKVSDFYGVMLIENNEYRYLGNSEEDTIDAIEDI